MNNKKTLLILAGGLGTRFGGSKQIEKVGPNEEFIIDYSIYDAIEAGFTKVVLIINKEMKEIFKETLEKRINNKIEIVYVYQESTNIPTKYKNKIVREKPWGTGHAILCAKNEINEPFIVISADDFYGKATFRKTSEFINSLKPSNKFEYAIPGYKIKDTISQNGTVKRGVCTVEKNYLTKIEESIISIENNKYFAIPIESQANSRQISGSTLVAMSFYVFTPEIFNELENKFELFLEKEEDLLNKEYFMTEVLEELIEEEKVTVKVIKTSGKWTGITYKEDINKTKR